MFKVAVEMHERNRWIVHHSVRKSVDSYFRRTQIVAQELTPGKAKEVLARGVFGEGFEYTDGERSFANPDDDEEERSNRDAVDTERDSGVHPSRM